MKHIYYILRAIYRWFYCKFKIITAYTYYLEDRKQYHVVEDDGHYKIVSSKSLKHHNRIAKKTHQFKHLTMKDINEMAIYSTPLKKKTEK